MSVVLMSRILGLEKPMTTQGREGFPISMVFSRFLKAPVAQGQMGSFYHIIFT